MLTLTLDANMILLCVSLVVAGVGIGILILAIPGVIAQTALGNVNYLAGALLAIGSIPGAIIGARLTKRVPERTLRYAFAFLLFIAAIGLLVNELMV